MAPFKYLLERMEEWEKGGGRERGGRRVLRKREGERKNPAAKNLAGRATENRAWFTFWKSDARIYNY